MVRSKEIGVRAPTNLDHEAMVCKKDMCNTPRQLVVSSHIDT